MTFHYKYQRILDVKEMEQKAVQSEVSQVKQSIEQSEQEKVKWLEHLNELENKKLLEQQQGIRVADLKNYMYIEEYVGEQIQTTERAQFFLNQKMSKVEQQLVETSIEQKKWGRLKETAKTTFLHEATKLEQKVADETSTLRYAQPMPR